MKYEYFYAANSLPLNFKLNLDVVLKILFVTTSHF